MINKQTTMKTQEITKTIVYIFYYKGNEFVSSVRKETEKAVMLELCFDSNWHGTFKNYWIPKSLLNVVSEREEETEIILTCEDLPNWFIFN